jgi:hypothetical protein
LSAFTFEFYGFQMYNAIVNPNNPLVRAVLKMMVASGDYFFFTVNPNASRWHSDPKSGKRIWPG